MGYAGRIAAAARQAVSKHQLMTHTSAISYRVLVLLVPLTLLGFALLGLFGLESVWTKSMAPALRPRLSTPVYDAIDYSVKRIFSGEGVGLIVFAGALLVWQLTWTMLGVSVALDSIHDVDDHRPLLRRIAISAGLGVTVGAAFIGSVFVVAVVPRLASGELELALKLVGFVVAAALLMLALGLLIRYAPAEHPPPGWASAGSILIVVSWLVASALFGFWSASIANYRSATGNLTVFLVLTAYVFVSVAIFLIGVELDELARGESDEQPEHEKRQAA